MLSYSCALIYINVYSTYICICSIQPFELDASLGSETLGCCPSGWSALAGWQQRLLLLLLLDIIFGKRKTFLNCGNASTKFALPSAR